MNVRVDLSTPIYDGMEVVFRTPCNASDVTGLNVYYTKDGVQESQNFAFADANANNLGHLDALFAEGAVVKVILDTDTNMAFVQNADTNAYLESRFDEVSTDDSKVSGKTWSSKNTVDKLCPAIEESGTIVSCQPVEGYPLTVQTEEGATQIVRCGKNLLPDDFVQGNYEGVYYMLYLPPGNYCVWAEREEGVTNGYVYLEKSTDGGATWQAEDIGVVGKGSWNSTAGYILAGTQKFRVAFTVTGDENEKWALWAGASKQHLGAIQYIQIEMNAEPGNPVKTAYEPYNGGIFAPREAIPALAGINTLRADIGNITVTGRADPNAVIENLTNAIIALGGNI